MCPKQLAELRYARRWGGPERATVLRKSKRDERGLIERNCRQAKRFAEGLPVADFQVLNDVVLNQVLVSFGNADQTSRVITEIQDDGACWCGRTEWHGYTAMRISVSSWATTDEDVERSLAAMVRIARSVCVAV